MHLRMEKVSHIYLPNTSQQVKALDEISLQVAPGEILAIIGRTGSGKSTLIQMMNGLIKPTGGQIWIGDQEITGKSKVNLAKIRQQVGLVFQYPEYQLFEDTVFNDVAFGPKNLSFSTAETKEKVEWALAQVGLEPGEVGACSPLSLSGGQKRRVAIAGVLAMGPKILILDEPTAALDPAGRKALLQLLKELREKQGITVIVVSHSMDEVAQLADRIIVLDGGKIIAQGTPRELFASSNLLDEIGLEPPRVVALLKNLRAQGLEVSYNKLTVSEAVEEIMAAKGRKNCV